MSQKEKEELLKKIDEIITNSGIGYLRTYPEDDCEDRRDWENVHDDWYNAIYGLIEIRDNINEL